MRAVDLPWKKGDDPLHTEVWESCRWMHVLIGTSTGDTAVHVQPLYGHSGRPEENTVFFGRVLEYVARQGNAPQILGGNVDAPLDDLHRLPPALSMTLLTRRLVDADAEMAAAMGHPCVCRYEGGAGMSSTCIDGILVSTALAPALRSAAALEDTAIPGHVPAAFDIDLEAVAQRVIRFVKPPRLDILWRGREEMETLAECLLGPLTSEWEGVLARGDVDEALGYWT